MKPIKLLFTVLSVLVYACIICYLAIAAPLLFGFHPVVVLSGSMEPTYHVGGVIYYKSVPFSEIEVGDPITFKMGNDGTMATHRVIKKDEIQQQFNTRGDANPSDDPNPVSYEMVVGKASKFCIPYAGYFVNYGRQLYVIIAMAAVLILNAALDILFPEKKKENRSDAETGNQGE